jgi:hypothetical protein
MLTRLKLHRFRHIQPGTELMFTERFNVLLGKNGTGKTTLLQLVSMVLRSDFSELREEEFDLEYDLSSPGGACWVRFENKRRSSPPEVAVRGGARARQYHPRVTVDLHAKREPSGDDHRYEIEVDGAALRWREAVDPWRAGSPVDAFEGSLFVALARGIPFSDPAWFPGWKTLLDLAEAGAWAHRFDESLDVFDSITDAYRTPEPGRTPPAALRIKFEGKSPEREAIFSPHQYRPAIPEPGQSSAKVDLSGDSSLAKLPQLTGIKTMSMSLAVEGSTPEPDGLWWIFGHADFVFSAGKGSTFNHNRLSYGQKRLLAFLYYLDANPTYVVADELVNGMHHDWIRACLDEIGARQAFLTSQNPLLLDYLPLESVEQVQRSFLQCRAEVVDDETRISWSNLAADDAAELFADYKVGIQPVGEILRARGLW